MIHNQNSNRYRNRSLWNHRRRLNHVISPVAKFPISYEIIVQTTATIFVKKVLIFHTSRLDEIQAVFDQPSLVPIIEISRTRLKYYTIETKNCSQSELARSETYSRKKKLGCGSTARAIVGAGKKHGVQICIRSHQSHLTHKIAP